MGLEGCDGVVWTLIANGWSLEGATGRKQRLRNIDVHTLLIMWMLRYIRY